MTDNTITLNLTHPTELEFELTTNGLNKNSEEPMVRFMLVDSEKGISYAFPCTKQDKKSWIAHLPQVNIDITNDHTFCIECIIDGHYFAPAQGIVNFIDEPIVEMSDEYPEVSISSIKPKQKKKSVNEGAEAINITGQYAPTNDLLKPEHKPKDSSAKTPKMEPMDELIDRDELGNFTPGHGGHQYAQEDDVEDPRSLVDKMLNRGKNTGLADIERTPGKGKLFTRDPEGKVVIPGLETKEQKERIQSLNQKIRDVLKQ